MDIDLILLRTPTVNIFHYVNFTKGKPSSAGNIQKAGQIPFPVGHFALISNLPYKNETLPKVCIRPEVHKALSFSHLKS